jgi:hypothetical protein
MIIEHRTFRLAADADEAAFLAADRRVQAEVAPFQHGFIRRTTARGPDGRWLVETLWFRDVDATAAADEQSAAVDALHECVDPASVDVVRWSTLD